MPSQPKQRRIPKYEGETVTVRNVSNGTESEWPADQWKEQKLSLAGKFVEVKKPATPPEVKALAEKQAEKPVTKGKSAKQAKPEVIEEKTETSPSEATEQ